MFLQETKTKRGGKTYISYLVRESFRTANGPRGRTICNLTHLPKEVRELVGQALKGQALVPVDRLEVNNIHSFGGCMALQDAAQRNQLPAALAPLTPRNAALVQAMIFGSLLFPPAMTPFSTEAKTVRLATYCGLDPDRERFEQTDLDAALQELDRCWPEIRMLLLRPPHEEVRALALFKASLSPPEMGAIGMDADGIPVPVMPEDQEPLVEYESPPLLLMDEEIAGQMHPAQLENHPHVIELAPGSVVALLRQLNHVQLLDALKAGNPVEIRHHGRRHILCNPGPTQEPHSHDGHDGHLIVGSLKNLVPIPGPVENGATALRCLQANLPAERLPGAVAMEWAARAREARIAFLPIEIVMGRPAHSSDGEPGAGVIAWRNHWNLRFLTHRLRCHLAREWHARGEFRSVEEVLRDLQEVHRATLTVNGAVVRRLTTHPSHGVEGLLARLGLGGMVGNC